MTETATAEPAPAVEPQRAEAWWVRHYTFTGTANDNAAVSYVLVYIRRESDGLYWNGSAWVPTTPASGPIWDTTLPEATSMTATDCVDFAST